MASIIGEKVRYRNATGDLTPPPGYVQVALEGGIRSFSQPTNLAYGANGSFKYLANKIGNVTFSNSTFGGDPARNIIKGGFAEVNEANKNELTQQAINSNINDAQEGAEDAIAKAQADIAKAQAEAQAIVLAEQLKSKKILLYGGIGAGVLLIGVILFIVLRKKKKG